MSHINQVNELKPKKSVRFVLKNYHPPSGTSGFWTPEEDSRLCEVIKQYGGRLRWPEIAKLVGGRSHKQCRERWHNNIKPGLNKGAWTEAEERILRIGHAKLGNKWAAIGRMMQGRTGNMVKNYWNSKQRRSQFPMDYNLPGDSGNQRAVLQTYARTVSTQESSSRNEMAADKEVTQVLVELPGNARNFDLNDPPVDEDK